MKPDVMALLALALAPAALHAGAGLAPCAPGRVLPAYSHNDERRSRPLETALALGYAGVEVDLHLVRGRLLVGHDREETRPGRTFEALYLRPLAERFARCRAILPGGRTFLLFVDLKSKGMAGYRALRAALASEPSLVTTVRDGRETEGPVTVVLVGWCPPLDTLRSEATRYVSVQRVVSGDAGSAAGWSDEAPSLVRLISLDASRLPGWPGTGSAPAAWAEAFGSLRAAAAARPGRITRVHHLRENARLYAYALDQGVDLIGSEALAETARLLAPADQ